MIIIKDTYKVTCISMCPSNAQLCWAKKNNDSTVQLVIVDIKNPTIKMVRFRGNIFNLIKQFELSSQNLGVHQFG